MAMRDIDLGGGWHFYSNEESFLGERIAALTDPELAAQPGIDFTMYALVAGAHKLREMKGAPPWRI